MKRQNQQHLSIPSGLFDVFLIFFGQQWSFMALRNQIYQTLENTHVTWIYVSRFLEGFVVNKNIEYHQTYSLVYSKTVPHRKKAIYDQ